MSETTKELDLKSAGRLLRLARKKQGLTMEQVSRKIGISINYVSILEKGERMNPSDEILCQLSRLLLIDEKELFSLYGRLPVSLAEEIVKNKTLFDALYEVKHDVNLTDADRQKLYKEIQELCLTYKP
ncbi:helix-turn-helix domain-containing protein [Bacillus thuringiensis]|uniref:helix-turn-helix domain-containing protein n=1 Tax=Bacillus thuringiensis TaxID=1428 RepID=UPI000BFB3FA1|nr:helix-turn-helix transcriptional regulator [Bacillus thuringiensis]PGT89890.1 hypothetical protein COD17_09065 [Bacillus thuringiensis]